ncbi:MarR family winged helix-turn-helix transcriptional regulator [Arthrobacter sp. RCC_34]|uniref:MarR family winged helix-turn-helix transcriptional regulator n=1 Tax=Arthrobacter sp. RCC_34 TaxID=3239230 RepID=UPI0035236E60
MENEETVAVPVGHYLFNEALREYGATYANVARAFAAREGLHSTDATAMIEILAAEERGDPLSPARLSDIIGLTFGATSSLLNRLESAGHVTRSRVHADRRIVTLHSTPGVQAIADDYFDPLGANIANVLTKYSPDTIETFTRLLHEICTTMGEYMVAPARPSIGD